MDDTQQQLTKGQQTVLAAQELVDDMRSNLELFNKRADALESAINQELDELEKDIAKAEERIEEIDKETIEKIDDVVIDSLQGEDDEDEVSEDID